jgi:hypothetical protein
VSAKAAPGVKVNTPRQATAAISSRLVIGIRFTFLPFDGTGDPVRIHDHLPRRPRARHVGRHRTPSDNPSLATRCANTRKRPSGYRKPTACWATYRWLWPSTDQVEGRVAARMRSGGGPSDVTIVINKAPYDDRPFGCDQLLPHIISFGSRLTVHLVEADGPRFHRTYTGTRKAITA